MTIEELKAEYEKHHAAYSQRLDELKTGAAIDADQLAFDLWAKQDHWRRRWEDAVRTEGKSEYRYH
jgi:hypothetical protein